MDSSKPKQRSANAERQARYRERKKNQSLSDDFQSFLPSGVPQQVTNSMLSPFSAIGDNVRQSVNQSFNGYTLDLSGGILAALGGIGGYRFVKSNVERPSMTDIMLGIGCGIGVGVLTDVGLKHLMGYIQKPDAINVTEHQAMSDIPTVSMQRPISGAEMQGMMFSGIQLRGDLVDFIGRSMPLHSSIQVVGLSGHGKSHLLTKLAASFSAFTSVLYISTEEGLSDKVKERFRRYNALENVFFMTAFTRDDIVAFLQQGHYRYVVIDSISNLNLSNNDARQFVKWLSSRVDLLMYSLHATKDGDFQGSMSLLHDATVQIEVDSGVAIVKKNRCGESGKTMNLFPQGSPQILPIQKTSDVQRYG